MAIVIITSTILCKKKPPEENYLEPVNISNNSGRSENPSIAVDSKGTVHLVWNDRTLGNEEILYAMKPVGDSWSEPVQVTHNSGASRSPFIVIDKNDKIHLVWQQIVYHEPSSYWEIFYTWRSAGDTWATPETISIYGLSTGPRLAVDENVGLHLFWREAFSPDTGFNYYAYKPSGGTWQDFQAFPFGVTMYPSPCDIKIDKSGGVHIVLESSSEVYYIERKPSGEWLDKTKISHSPTDWRLSISPSFEIGTDGSLNIVWFECDTALEGIAYLKRTPQGEWLPIISPFKNDEWKDYWGLSQPRIGIGKSGNLYVVWVGIKIGYGIKEGDTWTDSKTLVINKKGGDRPALAIDYEEQVQFVWQQPDSLNSENYEIYYIDFKP